MLHIFYVVLIYGVQAITTDSDTDKSNGHAQLFIIKFASHCCWIETFYMGNLFAVHINKEAKRKDRKSVV